MTEDKGISEIRAALSACDADVAVPLEYLADTVRAVLKERPSAPRVFFPGDTVPARVWVSYLTPSGIAVGVSSRDWMTLDGAAVELTLPSVDEWQAVVDNATGQRADSEWQHTEGTNP